jgi:acetyl esterase/lipase
MLFALMPDETLPDTERVESIHLWQSGAPGALGQDESDSPRIDYYRAKARNAAAVVVCPGGGYGFLAADHEGRMAAAYFNRLGVDAFVLHYRLGPKYRHPVMLGDAARAVRTVRARAGEWQIDPARVGILGFSAGGHLASTVSTQFDAGSPDAPDPINQVSSRPDFAMLIYPVITMSGPHAHAGSRKSLLGESPADALVESMSSQTRITSQTPPTFLLHALDDGPVPPENSEIYASALLKHRVPHTAHYLERGGHGFGFGKVDKPLSDPIVAAWPDLLAAWLKGRGLLEAGKA